MRRPGRIRFVCLLFLIGWGAVSLSGIGVSPDDRKIDPLAQATDDPALKAAQDRTMEGSILYGGAAPVFIRLSDDDPYLPQRIRSLGGDAQQITPRLFAARISRDATRYISNWPQVAYIESVKRVRPLLDVSRPAVSADVVQLGTGLPPPFTTGLSGAGVYIGVVDSGLSGAHLDFHTGGSGSPSRVVHTYVSPQLPMPNVVDNAFIDEEGHGTHVTGIAAGNGFSSAGKYTGMAPGTSLMIGKTSFFTDDVVAAVSDLLTFAGSTPVAINLSLGLMRGPHDGTSAFETAVEAAATGGPKRLITVAAGNENQANEHFQATVPPFGSTTPALLNAVGVTAMPVDIWADGDDEYTVTATIGTTGSSTVTVLSGASGSSADGKISVSNKTSSPPNGATYIFVAFSRLSGITGCSIQLTRTRNGGTGIVDGYIESTEGRFSNSTAVGTISEPAGAPSAIAVGSFNTKDSGGNAIPGQALSAFSSIGPTRDGRLKPDVTAPGSLIDSARSAESTLPPLANDNYARLQGTSMAAPHVAGIAALVWQSNSALTGGQMRERLKRTANPPSDGTSAPNTTWGYGKVNALNAVSKPVAAIAAPATALPGAAVTLASDNSSGAFGNSLAYSWSLAQKPAGSGAALSAATPGTNFTPDVPGNYTVSLTVSQTSPTPSSATDNKVIHVNNIPVASITGPASSDNVSAPATFSGSGSFDPIDNSALTYRWIMVSRPSGSAATLPTNSVSSVTFTPDVGGTYVVGLRADDGLDNSALATHAYAAAAAPPSSGGGGGGCSINPDAGNEDPLSAGTSALFIFFPIVFFVVRRKLRS